jgi:hypothetical protein
MDTELFTLREAAKDALAISIAAKNALHDAELAAQTALREYSSALDKVYAAANLPRNQDAFTGGVNPTADNGDKDRANPVEAPTTAQGVAANELTVALTEWLIRNDVFDEDNQTSVMEQFGEYSDRILKAAIVPPTDPDAETGQYSTEKYAKAHPFTTVKETKPGGSKPSTKSK